MLRIEISSGGLGTPVLDFQTALSSFISDADSVISSFKTVRNSTYSLNGGVGDLQGSLDSIDTRIQAEEAKKSAAEKVQTKANDFLQLAERVDRQVAGYVNQNKEELYSVNPWLRPATSVSEDAPWYEKAWNWLCEKGKAIDSFLKDTAKKLWDAISKPENLWKIVVGVVVIAAAVIVTVATGGAAIPALLAMAKAALTAGLISAAIGGGVTAVAAAVSGDTFDEAVTKTINSAVSGFCSGFMWGGIFAAGSQVLSCLTLPKTPTNLDTARQTGVEEAKKIEIDAIRNNASKYDWTPQQKADLLRNGSFKNTGIDGCHILDASRYPRFANNPDNIILLPRWTKHFQVVHGGSWSNPSNWEAILQEMPQFTSQVAHIKRLGLYSDIITSWVTPTIPATIAGTVDSMK